MPLIKSKSDKAFKHNLKAELAAGKPRAQSLAIAYSVKRRARADGGEVDELIRPPRNPARAPEAVEQAALDMTVNPIRDAVRAAKGKLTEREAQDFALGAAAGLIPIGRGLKAAKGIRAYHGSPHDFDRFDMSKIGTGEGAQAYGHGLYFAEAEPVAKQYRDVLASRADTDTAEGMARFWGNMYGREGGIKHFESVLKERAKYPKQFPEPIEKTYAAIQYLKSGGDLSPPGGRMYEVNINASPEQFLDWDAPLSKQPAAVHGLLGSRDVGVSRTFGPADPTLDSLRRDPKWKGRWDSQADEDRVWAHMRKLYPDYSDNQLSQIANEVYASVSGGKIPQSATGSRLYDVLTQRLGASKPEATQALAEAGIPGIKYLDQGSRTAGEGSRNYVVFDDNLIDILRKYGVGSIAALPPAVQASLGLMGDEGVKPKASGGALQIAYAAKRERGGHVGPIVSEVPGRTDRHHMEVPAGAYVIPAEAVSNLGENNTLAGLKALREVCAGSPEQIRKFFGATGRFDPHKLAVGGHVGQQQGDVIGRDVRAALRRIPASLGDPRLGIVGIATDTLRTGRLILVGTSSERTAPAFIRLARSFLGTRQRVVVRAHSRRVRRAGRRRGV